mgnify:CR=1 FL=1
MKKWIAIILVFLLSFTFIGCRDDNGEDDPNKKIEIQDIVIEADKQEIDVDEELQLTAKVMPAEADQAVIWSSKDPSIVTVDQTGKIVGKSAGTTEVVATSKVNSRVSKPINITVVSPVKYDDPTGVKLTAKKAEVAIDWTITLTATVEPETASQKVIFSSSDESIATVSDKGIVSGVAVGKVTITVKVEANQELTDSYFVTVIEKVTPEEEILNPELVSIDGETSVTEGRKIGLIASVEPNGVSQNVVWSSSDETIATVNMYGQITGLKAGEVYIFAASAKDTSIKAMIKITVKAKPVEEPYPDMKGYTIEIMAQALGEHDPFLQDYKAVDKTAKQDAWKEVQDKFNVILKVTSYPSTAPWGPDRIKYLNDNAKVGKAESDIFVSTTEWIKDLVEGNSIVDTTSYYRSYGENTLPAPMKASATYKNGLYAIPTSLVANIYVEQGLFYNYRLIKSLGLESPAKLFNENKWTYKDFEEYVKQASTQLKEGQSVLSGEPALYFMGMVNAAGSKLADTNRLEINLDFYKNQYAELVIDTLRRIKVDVGWGDNGWDATVDSFNKGDSIFQSGEYWFVGTSNRWSKDMWDEGGNSEYGYVPYPYPNSKTNEDTRTLYSGGSCYMMNAGREYPSGITQKDIYRAFVTMMLWTERNMEEDAQYSKETAMRQAAEARLSDPASVIAITSFKENKVIFDPFMRLLSDWNNIGPAIRSVVMDGKDYTEAIETVKSKYLEKLLELYGGQ